MSGRYLAKRLAWVDHNGSFNNPSDRRYKDNIKIFDQQILPNILQFSPYTFSIINGKNKLFGVIAQEVEKLFPYVITSRTFHIDDKECSNDFCDCHPQKDVPLSVEYSKFGVYAMQGIKELHNAFESKLQTLTSAFESKIQALEQRLAKLEQ